MEQSLPELLSKYGYLAVLVGCLLEGETVLMLAGFAAYQGLLSYPVVVAIGFFAGTLNDQSFFFIGRRSGEALFRRFPRLAARAGPARHRVHRYAASLSVGVRFMYGLRIVGPISLGMSELGAWRFVGLNMIGALIWAALFTAIGFIFGPTLENVIAQFRQQEGAGLWLVLGLVVVIGLICWARSRRH